MVGYTPPVPYVDLPSMTTQIWAADLNASTSALANLDCTLLPCDVATTTAIAMSGPLPVTIDSISVTAGMRVFNKDDATGANRGIYVAGSGTWARSNDLATGATFKSGTIVCIRAGGISGGVIYQISKSGAQTGLIGTDSLSINPVSRRIQSGGAGVAPRPGLNFTTGFTLTDNPGNSSTDVALSSSSGIPGYTTINRNGGTGGDKDLFVVPANAGFSYYYIDLSTIPSGDQGIVTVKDPTVTSEQTEINLVLQQGISSRPWDLSPSNIAWKTGMVPSVSIFQQSSLFDFTINTITMVKLTWMGPNIGYVGDVTTAIPPLFMPLANIPTSWTMTGGVTPWGGLNNQSIVTPIYFMRNTPVAVQAWMYNEVCHYCSAAMRTRLANNNYVIEYGSRFNADGPRGSVQTRGGIEWAFGYSDTDSHGGYISLGGADSENSSAAALRGVIAHEMSHGVSANYYGGANPLPGAGIGNGSEPALISQHSTLVTLQNDCITNGNGSTFSDEWFAEMLRGMRVGDNGTCQPATGSPLAAVGPGTTGGTPQSRADRFVNYINTLGLV